MDYDTRSLRTAADVPHFPYKDKAVTILHVSASGTVTSSSAVGGKRDIARALLPGDLLLAAWTGQWRTDVFVVDPEALRSALSV